MPYFKIKLLSKGTKRRRSSKGKVLKLFPYKKALVIVLPLVLIAGGIFWSFYTLYIKSPHFIVRDVIMKGRESNSRVNYEALQRMLINKNIFTLNLRKIRDDMLSNYNELLNLNLTRAFPDTIVATITLRKPVAQLYQEYYYPVDNDGVILSGVKDSPLNTLPVISGIYTNLSAQVGKLSNSNQIKRALLLLKEVKSSGILSEHALMGIDISNVRNAVFFLENGLEVKVGYEDFASRLENLKKVLRDPKLKLADVKYIDLRFKEPVIGLKWKK